MFVIEQPIPPAPAANSAANVLADWNAVYDAHNEVACLMLGSMTPELHRQFENYAPYEMLHELKSMLRTRSWKWRDQLERLGYVLPQDLTIGLILNRLTKDFTGFVRNYNMHNMGKIIGELHAMLIEYKKSLPKKADIPQVKMIKSGSDIQKESQKRPNRARDGKVKINPKPKPGYRIVSIVENGASNTKDIGGIFQNLQDLPRSSEPLILNTKRCYALEAIVVNQDPDEKSSPSPPHIDHCCHECGDLLGGIFYRQCTYDILREKLLNVNLLIAKIDALRDNPTPSSEVVIKSTSTFPNLFLEETNTFDNSILESETFRINLEEISSGSPTTHSELSLPDYKAFYVDNDHFKEKSSGSTTTHVDPDPGDLTSIDPEIRKNVSTTNVNVPLEDDQSSLFAYVVWIFLAFLTYLVVPPYLLSTRNEDTIFDPGISI
ncbi:hypothetical protein Tco_1029276 [Tanacetum coccineum]|uniref:Uncharacterized protein n=1 Tax=Tanacetum coccineum TaxID=301880 RepID=A0ABQ5G4D9_9ASTR